MREFSWKYFVMTGDVDAYMLYKEAEAQPPDEGVNEESNATSLQEDGVE